MRTTFLLTLVLCASLPTLVPAQLKPPASSAEIASAIDGLGVLGSVLYIAAHPDDENSALLAYLAGGRHVRTAYLSLTRGEGGQNLIGAEQGEALGIIRTEELLAARRIDGAGQFFTRAIDFGFSKSSDEALRLWDREAVLGDIVWVIRSFRPDVIITRFSPTIGGHGHHTASAILAREAFDAAADSTRFPGQLSLVRPWKARRLLYNRSTSSNQPFDTAQAIAIDVGGYNRFLGRSYTEIAGLSRSMHKSQAFGAAPERGSQVHYLLPTAGDTARRDLFDGIDLSWARVPGGERFGEMTEKLRQSFTLADPSASVPELLALDRELATLPAGGWREVKREAVREILRACLGLWVEAVTADSAVVPGGRVPLTVTLVNRSAVPVHLRSAGVRYGRADTLVDADLTENRPLSLGFTLRVPPDAPVSTPYWLAAPSEHACYAVTDQSLVGLPESPPPLDAHIALMIAGRQIDYTVPVEYRMVDPVEGELRRPVQVVPSVAVSIGERTLVLRDASPKTIMVRLRNLAAGEEQGSVRLELPGGWKADTLERSFRLAAGGEQEAAFRVTKTPAAVSGSFRVVVKDAGGSEYASGLRTIRYPHIVGQMFAPRSEGRIVALEAALRKKAIGYIMGAGDEVPAALRQLGYNVELITPDELSGGNLRRYETVVAGVRAYNTRPDLRANQERLLNYVREGGTYVVQYSVPEEGETDAVGPYALKLARDRVADEDAPVRFLRPDHLLVNHPNIISAGDFENWVQERGLSFASDWDSSYEAVLSCNDPGEPPRNGGLLFARYGKGCFLYTGYAFFRQLPAGVAGGYRLFINLLEASGGAPPVRRR